ncbi:MAG: ATP-dependent metallopeptidase FtsH/Yme1/Tma family protein, partial [Porcipelethomonas sp.]
MNNKNKGLLAYILVGALIIGAFFFIFSRVSDTGREEPYSEVISHFENYEVKSYTLDLGSGELEYLLVGEEKTRTYEVPNVSIFLEDTDSEGSDYRAEYNKRHPDEPLEQDYKKITDNSWILSTIPTILMLGIAVALFFFMMRQTSGGGKYSSFAKANIKNQHNNGKKITFADVAGADEEKHEMEEIVDFLKHPKKYEEIGARIPKGVLLLGP